MKQAKDFFGYISSKKFSEIGYSEQLAVLCTRLELVTSPDEDVLICWAVKNVYCDMYTDDVLFKGPALFALTTKKVIITASDRYIRIPIELFNGVYITINEYDDADEVLLSAQDFQAVFELERVRAKRLVNEINLQHRKLVRKICSVLGRGIKRSTVVIKG